MATSAPVDANTIFLTTSDQVNVPVHRKIAERSVLIKNLLEDLGDVTTEPIPIPNVRTYPPVCCRRAWC
jgi:S-phase kinase-associated protein 1